MIAMTTSQLNQRKRRSAHSTNDATWPSPAEKTKEIRNTGHSVPPSGGDDTNRPRENSQLGVRDQTSASGAPNLPGEIALVILSLSIVNCKHEFEGSFKIREIHRAAYQRNHYARSSMAAHETPEYASGPAHIPSRLVGAFSATHAAHAIARTRSLSRPSRQVPNVSFADSVIFT